MKVKEEAVKEEEEAVKEEEEAVKEEEEAVFPIRGPGVHPYGWNSVGIVERNCVKPEIDFSRHTDWEIENCRSDLVATLRKRALAMIFEVLCARKHLIGD